MLLLSSSYWYYYIYIVWRGTFYIKKIYTELSRTVRPTWSLGWKYESAPVKIYILYDDLKMIEEFLFFFVNFPANTSFVVRMVPYIGERKYLVEKNSKSSNKSMKVSNIQFFHVFFLIFRKSGKRFIKAPWIFYVPLFSYILEMDSYFCISIGFFIIPNQYTQWRSMWTKGISTKAFADLFFFFFFFGTAAACTRRISRYTLKDWTFFSQYYIMYCVLGHRHHHQTGKNPHIPVSPYSNQTMLTILLFLCITQSDLHFVTFRGILSKVKKW